MGQCYNILHNLFVHICVHNGPQLLHTVSCQGCIAQFVRYKTSPIVWQRLVHPPASLVNINSLSSPRLDLLLWLSKLYSWFPIITCLPILLLNILFHFITFLLCIINLLASNPLATQDLLILDQINQMILNLEQQLDEQHCLVPNDFWLYLHITLPLKFPSTFMILNSEDFTLNNVFQVDSSGFQFQFLESSFKFFICKSPYTEQLKPN